MVIGSTGRVNDSVSDGERTDGERSLFQGQPELNGPGLFSIPDQMEFTSRSHKFVH